MEKFEPFVDEVKAASKDGEEGLLASQSSQSEVMEAEETQGKDLMLQPAERTNSVADLKSKLEGATKVMPSDPNITFCKPRRIAINLVLYCFLWSISSFNYYLITFYMKYVPGSIYVNTTASALSENLSYVVSGLLLNVIGIKLCYVCALIIASVGGFLLAAMPATGLVEASFVLICKFGISWSFNNCYLSTPLLFPAHLRVRVFGICHLLASFVTVLAPLLAEVQPPTPMIVFTITSVGILVISMLINTKIRY